MTIQGHAVAAERNALATEPQSLLQARRAGQQHLSSGADYALPRHIGTAPMERPGDLPGGAGESRGAGDCAIGRDKAPRNAPDRYQDLLTLVHSSNRSFRALGPSLTVPAYEGAAQVICYDEGDLPGGSARLMTILCFRL